MSQHLDTKTGSWYYQGKYKSITGKRINYKKRGFKTAKLARKAEEVFLANVTGTYGHVSFDELVAMYSEEYVAMNVKESTVVSDESYYTNHIKDVFGSTWIDAIDKTKVERWKLHMINKPRPLRDGTGYGCYAEKTINRALGVLKKYLSYAVYKNIIQINPAHGIKKYNNPEAIIDLSQEENFWELDEYKIFISYVQEEFWREVFEVMFGTGVREGELFALTWDKIDFDKKRMQIHYTINPKTKNGGPRKTSPKTKKSYRNIDMQGSVLEPLLRRYETAKRTDGFTPEYYVFGNLQPLSRSTLARHLDAYIKISNVKRITPHGFRHSHASMLINAGIDDSLIADRLGHTVAELRKTYAHIYSKSRQDMTAELDKIYKNI